MRKDATGLKVGIAFACLVALLVGVGWLGLSRMGQINASANRLFNEREQTLLETRQAVSYFNTNYRIVIRLLLLAPEENREAPALVAQLTENATKGTAAWKTIEAQPATPAEQELFSKVTSAQGAAYESLQRALALLVDEGKTAEGRKMMATETLPLLNKYRDSWGPYIEYEEDQMSQSRIQSRADYATARRWSATLIAVAIALAVCIAVFVTRRLSREMKERESAQSALRQLNEDLEKKVVERTEEVARAADALRAEADERSAQEADLRRLAAIVESSDDAIVAITLDGIVTDWNPGAERMLGYTRGEMIGQPISRIVPPDRLGEPSRSLLRLVEGNQVVRHETVRVRKDGKQIHVALTISPLRDSSGRVAGDSAIFRDITERKSIEEVHRRSEASFRSFVQNAPYGILRTTPEGRIVQVNPALVEMLGYSSEQEVLGLNMSRDVYRSPQGRLEATSWAKTQESVQGVEAEWKHKSGRSFTIRSSANVVRDSEGRVEFLEGFIEDISERRALELQLRQRQKMEAIGQLAGGVAHDFNNLLGVISGYAELAAEQIDPHSDLQRSVTQIQKAADRASGLTRQLLAFSRQQVLETKVLSLNSIVEDMAKMLPRLLGEDIELELRLDPKPGAVKADQNQIEQVLLNLAVNARDAMPEGGQLVIQTGRARFDSTLALKHPSMAPGDYVLLSVRDTGMGMDQQAQAHIFEPFFTTKERGRGTGLGLATVYGFVKQIGGYVWVESAPGAGATFEIYLPVACEVAPQASPHAATPATSPATGTILLVEDEESLRTLTRSLLEQGGYTVIEAANGAEAIEIATGYCEHIHLLLTDMVMPGMGGRAVAERVAQLHPGIHVAYMSGYIGFTPREADELNGVIIAKPFTRSVLLQKLSEAMELEPKAVRT
ncbi:MAG TPA: PAS domain S-box protein [Verrucomicrobiae bacterium]|nr:PAS domain S-box protein [Verrucomicrobiae bacterium]